MVLTLSCNTLESSSPAKTPVNEVNSDRMVFNQIKLCRILSK